MSHLNKVILALLCAGALFYFDSREKTHVGNNLLGTDADSIRVRIGGISLRSHCYVSVKKRRRPVKCPVCEKWVRTLETRARPDGSTYRRYECANEHRFVTKEKVERVLVVHHKRKKA